MTNYSAKYLIVVLVSSFLFSCASLNSQSQLEQGERYFNSGLYKTALEQLLPLAADGNAKAEYAVGYLYYYGYGVAQDTQTGAFWIKRSADQKYEPAMKALTLFQTTPRAASR
jgi:TPR repeat protein